MKLLLDMNLSPLWLATLKDAGFEAEHWSAVGAADAPDVEIMRYAKTNGYVVCTQDLDFGLMLVATHSSKPSVVQIRAQDVLPKSIGRRVIDALRQMEAELDEGALVTIDPKKTRLRVLSLVPRD